MDKLVNELLTLLRELLAGQDRRLKLARALAPFLARHFKKPMSNAAMQHKSRTIYGYSRC